jgi:hypothetical protein
METEVEMLEFLSVYANGWIGMFHAAFAFGTADGVRYLLMGLPVALLAGYLDRSFNKRHQWNRWVALCSTTLVTTTAFFFWPAFLAIDFLVAAVFAPIFLTLGSMILLVRSLRWILGGATVRP